MLNMLEISQSSNFLDNQSSPLCVSVMCSFNIDGAVAKDIE